MCNPKPRRRSFNFNGRNLEVRAECVDEGWKIQIYENGKPTTSFSYSVPHEQFIGLKMHLSCDPVGWSMDMAQGDIQRGLAIFREPE